MVFQVNSGPINRLSRRQLLRGGTFALGAMISVTLGHSVLADDGDGDGGGGTGGSSTGGGSTGGSGSGGGADGSGTSGGSTTGGGNTGASGGAGHFRVRVIDARLNGLQRIARHRLVYAAVTDWIPTRVHALNIVAMTPEEAGTAKHGLSIRRC